MPGAPEWGSRTQVARGQSAAGRHSPAAPEAGSPGAVNTLHNCAVPGTLDIGKEGERREDTDPETDGGRENKAESRVFDEQQDKNKEAEPERSGFCFRTWRTWRTGGFWPEALFQPPLHPGRCGGDSPSLQMGKRRLTGLKRYACDNL